MDKLLQFFDKIIPLLPFYPPWARLLFAVSFLGVMLSIGIFVVMYPAASKRMDDTSERSAIGLDVSLLETQNSSDDPLGLAGDPWAVNYRLSRENENIIIAPRVGYLDLLARGGPIYAAYYQHTPFHGDLPALDIKVVNNGKDSLFISGAVFEVDQSEVDREPIIIIQGDFFSNDARRILLINDGWGDVERPVLRFNLMPSNPHDWTRERGFAKPAVTLQQPFTNVLQCESFSEAAEVDISQVFNNAGVNLERLAALTKGRIPLLRPQEVLTPEEYDQFKKTLGPFADNLALVEGEIEYNTSAAPAGKRIVRFATFVHLYDMILPSAVAPPTYEYKVLLQTEGLRYSVPVNVSQAIKPGETDRFTFRVAAPESSHHRFRIRFFYNGQKELLSEPISLKIFVPRSVVRLLTRRG
jgi:hypothetical protein